MTWSGVIGQALMQTPELVAEVLAGEHVDDVGHRPWRRSVSMLVIVGVRERAAHHREVQHPGQGDVVGPAGAAGDQPLVLLAAPVAADLAAGGGRVLDGGHAVAPSVAAVACSAAYCTALTMLW